MDVPHPSPEPLTPGDQAEVYLSEDDPDSEYHGTEVVVVERIEDDLNTETGRSLDRFQYRVKEAATGEVIPVDFRHDDLVLRHGKE
jgi:hypothetical protein